MCGPGAVAVVRYPDMRILFVNNQFEYHTGYTHEEVTSAPLFFSGLIDEHQHSQLSNQMLLVDRSIQAYSSYVIYKLKNKNGGHTSFYLYASPMPDDPEHGKMYYFLMHPDLSKWGMPFISLDSKEQFLEQFNSEDFGTFEWIVDTGQIYWSPGVYRIYELDDPNKTIDLKYVSAFVHPADEALVEQTLQKCIHGDGPINIEYRIITPDNRTKLIHCIAKTITAGNTKKMAGSVRDITNQRKIERDLKHKVDALNQSNKELEEFAYVASHDMQEPLRKIATFSDRLSEKYKELLTGEGAMYLSRIMASAQNMRSLIDSLLEFSRITKTKQLFEPVNLNLVLHEVKNELDLAMEETGTKLQYPRMPEITAVPSQMKQLFYNIINNAIKFRKSNVPPEINITIGRSAEKEKHRYNLAKETEYYKIQVTDNGIGFEEEFATRIFQVFQRLHGRSEYPGSGIGLAICKKIVEYHNGVIFAESTPGKGACFTIILPDHQTNTR
jgi:PAS domain S-box-containing protein